MTGPIYIYVARSETLDGTKTIKSDGWMYHAKGETLSAADVKSKALAMIADTSNVDPADLVVTEFSYVEDPEERNPTS